MRSFILSAALIGSALAATPALAQEYRGNAYNERGYNDRNDWQNDRGGYNQQSNQRLRQIGFRIDQGIRSRQISQREAYALRREYSYLVQLDARLSRGGLNPWERRTLDTRTQALAQRVRYFSTNDYGNPYGRSADRDGRYQNDGRYSNDGRPNDGRPGDGRDWDPRR